MNKKFSQTDKYKLFLPLILTEPPSKLRNWRRRKKLLSFKISIHDFHELNTVFYLSPIRCKYRHQCYNYRRRSTAKINVFASVRNSRFLMHGQNNSFHLNFTSCKHRHRYCIGIIQTFERMPFFKIF